MFYLVTTKVAPWIQRASDIKAEVIVNHELEHKLQQHNEEIIKLIKDVRLKVNTCLNMYLCQRTKWEFFLF